jgi:hypothetical protein
MARFFPRWSVLSKIENRVNSKSTSAIMVAGNSKLENEIGVANGFPNMDLKQDEIMLVKDVTDVLGLKEGDQVEISFDLF